MTQNHELLNIIACAADEGWEALNLSRRGLTEIPSAVFNLTNLKTLNLYNNQISEIPDAIANLTNLKTLNLYDNQISEIPDTIANLTNLKTLNLYNNQISEIPDVIANLSQLETLDLRGNLFPIPQEILVSQDSVGSVQEIFNYLNQIRRGEVRPLNEAKLFLIGQASVGKTSLMERLLYDRYDKNQPKTDGLNVETWTVKVDNIDIRLNVWDFGGQEIYHAMHEFFLTKRSLYLLVYDCRNTEEQNRIEYWLKLIENFGGQSPVIIVGNKNDQQSLDINQIGLRAKYSNIQAIIETSCETNTGIQELRAEICEQVTKLEETYELLLSSWFEVKHQLEAMPEDFITYAQYITICAQKNITDEQKQKQLLDILHRLGTVLNFHEKPTLERTKVLKPHWVTEGLYALLTDETLKTKKGVFTHQDISRILSPQRYPTTRHSYLISLMQEFELCFDLASDPPKFLIPSILPKSSPAEEYTKLAGETLDFQYHYPILPESILSRFIVLSHDKIHNQTYWRNGVMLVYQQNNEICNIARIKADLEDKKIFITISGREKTRRIFLGIIRDIFQKIHSTHPNLEITEWVPVPNYPDYPPLDYQELLGQELNEITTIFIAKLKLKLDLRKLLDGYESREDRQQHAKTYIENLVIYNQNGKGDNVAGDHIEGDKNG